MCKIFYMPTTDYVSDESVKKILKEHFGIQDAVISRTKNGKPYVENAPYFSISHTSKLAFIAFSSSNLGIDAEPLDRNTHYDSVIKNFPREEQKEIQCEKEFLKHWVAKESAVKYLGGTLARDLKRLAYMRNRLYYQDKPLSATLTFFEIEGHLLSICGEGNFTNPTFIPLSV